MYTQADEPAKLALSYGSYDTACSGKKPYESYEDARKGAKWLRKNIGPKVQTYLCSHCQLWHNGHDRKKKRL
jgi:hypothetical protein